MKAFFYTLLLISCALSTRPLSLYTLKTSNQLSDLQGCADAIKQDVLYIKAAIQNKDWSQVGNLLMNVSKTYIQCKDAQSELGQCYVISKAIISDLSDLFGLVKKKDYNPIHYYNAVKVVYNEAVDFGDSCFVNL